MKKSSLLLVYTGGTIGMKHNPADNTLHPFDFSQIIEEVPELGKFALKIDSVTFDPLIDSSDVEPSVWARLAGVIHDNYDDYDGFVVLHGTDTMAYSASALSFMLGNLGKPVIFTGSQLPIGVPRTDGRENLISAVEIAAAKNPDGSACVPEVAIFFDSFLLRGNRATKVSSENFRAFSSPNFPPLAEAGVNIRYNREFILPPGRGPLEVHDRLDTRVSILKIHPGITPELAETFILSPAIRAVILETYGSGNAMVRPWLKDILSHARSAGKLIVSVTQCLTGSVDMDLYATGKFLSDEGVLSGFDSTTEAMLAKLFYLLGSGLPREELISALSRSLRGEITTY
ncbi:MAG: type I asparaginase [Bacteroidales bacterium]|nr:type I asparaginase [Bacteroidales bacterium]